MSFETLILEKIGNVAKITLNRPDRLNAINTAMRWDLYNALEDVRKDNNIGAVIITGAPRIKEKEIRYTFSVGWDMTEATTGGPGEGPPVDLMEYIQDFEKPVIAMVNGFALGGGNELALACDFIFASENSEFGQPEIDRGFIPGWGGTQRLPRRVGLSQAKRIIFTGERISAREAERIGLADVVVPMDKLEETTMEFAKKLASKAPLAIKRIKEVMNKGIDTDLKSGLKLELEARDFLVTTEDFQEGIVSFFEKRSPKWKGK
ncbi:MAG: enoyl-CoA hydratase/isomerase family protein [Candidatus Bathyarchaeaceae archaeon]